MKIAVKIAFMAAATIPAAASAQEAGRMLSLDEAVAVTLTENPALKAAAYEERAAQQQRRAAIGLRMPQINVTGAYAYMAKDIGFDRTIRAERLRRQKVPTMLRRSLL